MARDKPLVNPLNGKLNSHNERLRQKIRTGMIVTRLGKHVKGEIEMSSTQIQAARILLDRTLPPLKPFDTQALSNGIKDVSHLTPQFLLSVIEGQASRKSTKPIDAAYSDDESD